MVDQQRHDYLQRRDAGEGLPIKLTGQGNIERCRTNFRQLLQKISIRWRPQVSDVSTLLSRARQSRRRPW